MLEDWEAFIVGSAWGWRKANGTRRFSYVFVEVARKNGKSLLGAGIGLRLAFFDDEPGAEVYAAATKRDQAKIVWGDARHMVLASAELKQRITTLTGALVREDTASKFVPLGADADTLDGLNVHGAIVDELHKHRNRDVLDVLETASGARRQPLRVVITTAGIRGQGVWADEHDYATNVVRGLVPDDAAFVYIATLDEGDDPFDESTWIKGNPNLGVSVGIDELREQAARAKSLPSRLNAFLRLRLNVPTEQVDRFLPVELWDENAAEPRIEAGALGYAGLDLAETTDLSAFVAIFPDGDDLDVLARFWIPGDNIRERSLRDGVPYEDWVRDGYIVATPGRITDQDRIRADIEALAEDYRLADIGYDPWRATQLVVSLQGEGASMSPVRQGYVSLSAPTRDLERLVLERRLRHGGHPVLRWMLGNLAVEMDPAGNVKPSKRASTARIDGIVALVMALSRWTAAQAVPEPPVPQVYVW